jgi:hypothetical protein
MSTSHLTKHAILRTAQRNIRPDDLELINLFGTEVEGGTILLRKDAQAVERDVKKLLAQIRRNVGKRMVCDADTLVTAYRVRRGKERRLLRTSKGRR